MAGWIEFGKMAIVNKNEFNSQVLRNFNESVNHVTIHVLMTPS